MINQLIRLKILILPISLVLVVVTIIFFIKPSFSDMNTAKAMLSQKQSQLDGLDGQSQSLKKLASDWTSLGDEKTLVGAALPEKENIDIYMSELTSKASRSGILLSSVQLEKKSSNFESTGISSYICGENAAGPLVSTNTPAPSSTPATTATGIEVPGDVSAGLASSSGGCLKMSKVSITAKGTWEQLLGFLKYLEDMNRISNIDKVDVSVDNQGQGQDQAPSDLLSVVVSINVFFKEGKQIGDTMLAAGPASQIQLNKKAIEKLKEAIYSPYAAPLVSPSGERNIFK